MRAWIGGGVMLAWALLAAGAAVLPLSPDTVALDRILTPPEPGLWLGSDDLGRPVWDRLVVGARTSFQVALGVVAISLVVGIVVGTVAGYVGGWLDHVVVRIIDVFLAFPGILLAIAIAGLLQPGLDNVVIALAAVSWVGFARLARAQVLSLRQRLHVLAAHALGCSAVRVMRVHILPLAVAPLIVEATFAIASAIIAEAGLSYLGLGVQPPDASWGSMIRDGTRYMLVAPHMVLAPGVALALVVLAVNLLGDALRDRLDVRRELL